MEVRERSGSCGYREKKGPEVLSSGSNVSSGQGRGFLFDVECELGQSSRLSTQG